MLRRQPCRPRIDATSYRFVLHTGGSIVSLLTALPEFSRIEVTVIWVMGLYH